MLAASSTTMDDNRELGAPESQGTITTRPLPVDTTHLGGKTLHLANVLQSSLDVGRIVEMFSEEIGGVVPHDSLEYSNPAEQIKVILGKPQSHSCRYQLVLMDKPLGELAVTRGTRFAGADLERLETMLCALIYPLRNAILYKRAVETAYKDPVTGVNNRAALNMTLDREVELSHRHGTPLSLVMLDVDRFKVINDTYGHLAGDAALRALADCLMACTRASDMVFRFGGEEFTVVLSNTDLAGARLLAARIRESVEQTEFCCDGIRLRLTVSVGIANLEPGDDAAALTGKVDQALYRAKATGRNRVIEYRPDTQAT